MLKNDNLYRLFYGSLVIYWFLGIALVNVNINISILKKILLVISLISFLIMWINTKYNKKELIIQIILILLSILLFYFSGMDNDGILTFVPAIIGLKNITIRDAVKTMFWSLLVSLIIFLILCLIGILPVTYYLKIDAFGNHYNMIKLANQHGNSIFVLIYNLICSYLYAYYDKITKLKLLFLAIFVIICYCLFYSRTGLLILSLTIIGTYFIKYGKIIINGKFKSVIYFFLQNSYIIFYSCVFIIGKYMHGSFIYNLLNKLVTSRIGEVHHYLVDVGVGLFPKVEEYYWICDNTQVKVMLSYGLIFTCIYLIYSRKTLKALHKNNMKFEMFLMIMYLLYSYSEVAFFKPISDFTMLFFVYSIGIFNFKDKELLNEKENI